MPEGWEENETAHDRSKPHHLSNMVEETARECIPASESGLLVFIDDMTAEGSSRMDSEVYRVMISAQITTKPVEK